MMKRLSQILLTSVFVIFIAACGGGSSDSGGGSVTITTPGDSIPANFVGTYRGTATLTAEAVGLSETDTFAITITVTDDGRIRFDGDDPDETFTVGLSNSGEFAGSFTINEDECSGTVQISGRVDGSRASGDVSGSGTCSDDSGLTIDVTFTGTFSATK